MKKHATHISKNSVRLLCHHLRWCSKLQDTEASLFAFKVPLTGSWSSSVLEITRLDLSTFQDLLGFGQKIISEKKFTIQKCVGRLL